MRTRTFKVKNPPIEFVRWLNEEYQNGEIKHFVFKNFYWYHGSDPLSNRVYGCFVMKDDILWSNPQGYISFFLLDTNLMRMRKSK